MLEDVTQTFFGSESSIENFLSTTLTSLYNSDIRIYLGKVEKAKKIQVRAIKKRADYNYSSNSVPSWWMD